jgi:hypothetical protein
MKRSTNKGLMPPATQALAALAIAAALLPTASVLGGTVIDLTADGVASGSISPYLGDTAIFMRDNSQPTGTGVFDPFLTVDSAGNQHVEQGYNTDSSNQQLPFDDLRNHWNKNLQKKDLAVVNGYYVFTLDSNETGNGSDNRFLSVDNIQLYTSPTGSQTTTDTTGGKINFASGTLRWALNSLADPLNLNGNWVKIDSTRNTPLQPTSGSGSADMVVMIPTSALAGAADDDFVYFYNMNGDHWDANGDDPSTVGTGAEAGFEEWNALVGPSVPDGSSTMLLLGSALTALAAVRRKLVS